MEKTLNANMNIMIHAPYKSIKKFGFKTIFFTLLFKRGSPFRAITIAGIRRYQCFLSAGLFFDFPVTFYEIHQLVYIQSFGNDLFVFVRDKYFGRAINVVHRSEIIM